MPGTQSEPWKRGPSFGAAILCNAHGLVMTNVLSSSQSCKNLLLSVQLGRNDPGDRLTDHLVRDVTEDMRRAGIPWGYAARAICLNSNGSTEPLSMSFPATRSAEVEADGHGELDALARQLRRRRRERVRAAQE